MKTQDQISIGMNFRAEKSHNGNAILKLFNKQAEKLKVQRFAWMAMFIIFQSCLASIACMYILQNKASDFMLVSCTMLAMGCNALFIAQASAKWCLVSFYLSTVFNFIFIAINC